MRTATHALTIVSILIGVAAVGAQAPGPRPAIFVEEIKVSGPPPTFAVVERLMSFDVDGDARVSSGELPERMQGLVPRGDKNADAALDAREVLALAKEASSGFRRVSVRTTPSDGLPGVLSDLKLPPEKHAPALVIVQMLRLPLNVNDPAAAARLKDVKALLDEEEYENFLAAATRLSRGGDLAFRNVETIIRRPQLPR